LSGIATAEKSFDRGSDPAAWAAIDIRSTSITAGDDRRPSKGAENCF
jgi:hypothetical protein